jgi:TolB protein
MRQSIFICVLALLLGCVLSTAEAAFPGANGRILFTARSGECFQLFTVGSDGSDSRQVSDSALCKSNGEWAPDGTRIAFNSGVGTFEGDIYVMKADGTSVKRVTSGSRSGDAAPHWSPDGRKLVFTRSTRREDGSADADIFKVNLDGTGLKRIASSPLNDVSPAWGPTGRRIVFVSERDNVDYEVFSVRSDGTGLKRLTRNRVDDESPDWSPGGGQIVFSRYTSAEDGSVQIFKMNRDGSEQLQLTTGDLPNWFPVWVPDGRSILFLHDDPMQIYRMDRDGTDVVRVTDTGEAHYALDWQPRPDGRQTTRSWSETGLLRTGGFGFQRAPAKVGCQVR